MLVKSSRPDPVAEQTAAPKKSASKQKVAQKRIKNSGKLVRLSGEVPAALARATKLPARISADTPLTLTIVLNRTDQSAFDAFLYDVYDPHSPAYRHFLTPLQVSDRFGPSPESYDAVLHYLQRNGFKLVEGSANRLTITVRGTRAQAERTFKVHIGEYRIGERTFYANDSDPAFPQKIASSVQAVLGLTDLARPQSAQFTVLQAVGDYLSDLVDLLSSIALNFCGPGVTVDSCPGGLTQAVATVVRTTASAIRQLAAAGKPQNGPDPVCSWTGIDGTGQTIGLVEFDSFQTSDVADYLNLIQYSPTLISNVSTVLVNGGAGAPGPHQNEVLLDIDNIVAVAPGAQVRVYEAPFPGAGSSFQPVINMMINDGVTVISNSWSYCEDQTTQADVNSIDALFQTAAASGISVFNAAGDTGSTCLDGASNTVGVPADSPNATAVGGTSLTVAPGPSYGSETWWNGLTAVPTTGQGGFGISQFFARPAYQNGFNAAANRSVPDVSVSADPANGGSFICLATGGGCPTGLFNGGTSGGAPTWAAFQALLNQSVGQTLGFVNPIYYGFAGAPAFHDAASMGSNFAHVGLGSPNLSALHLLLCGQTAGTPSDTVSQVIALTPTGIPLVTGDGIPADGSTEGGVLVRLRDANGNLVSGKTITLSGTGSATITPASVVTSIDGAAVFNVKDLVAESVTFTPTDTSDGNLVLQSVTIPFIVPVAAAGGIGAFPTTVQADGTSSSTITVTLQDSLSRGTPGKQVILSQGSGHSIVNGPNPSVTDANGQIQFTATNVITESVTYTATDVTDGNLPVPGSATVNFVNGSAFNCGGPPVPQPGWALTSPETGFSLSNNCVGASGTAWDPQGNLWVNDYATGNIYKFSPAGGTAGMGTLIGMVPGASATCNHGLAFSKDGQHLYVARQWCGFGGNGDVVEISTADAHVIRALTDAGAMSCATGIATDPISGDLFVTSPCQSANNLWRISNPESPTPVVSVYATPGRAIGLNFTPDGTIWTEAYPFNTTDHQLVKISGTNSPQPGTVTVLSTNAPQFAGGVLPVANPADPGNPSFLLVTNAPASSGNSGSVSKVDLTQNPPVITTIATGESGEIFVNGGPDGCAYASDGDRVDRITAADGTCNFAGSSAQPRLSLTPLIVTPNPLQGSTQTFTATLSNVGSPANTAVLFAITGANPQFKVVPADVNGQATLSYLGYFAGPDRIIATAQPAGVPLTSNPSLVTWEVGAHATFLSLSDSTKSGTPGQAVGVRASLSDVSASPPVALAAQTVNFALGNNMCSASTNAHGIATCQITPSQAGMQTLTATFAGTSQFVGSSDSVGFNVVAPPTPTPTPTATPTPTPTPSPTPIGGSQITRTNVTCSQFVAGTAASLSRLRYSLEPPANATIKEVNPGAFFYWVTVTASAGSNTFTINQTITSGNFNTLFSIQSGSNVFNSNCTSVHPTITQSGGTVSVTFNAPTAGTYIISIKFDSQSLVGKPAPSPTTTVHYDFRTIGVPGSTSGLDLIKK